MKFAPKIVVLEDDRASSILIATLQRQEGYHALEAGEGRYALELTMKERPVLFISDVIVPDMNGSEVVKNLMGANIIRELKILFLTSLLGISGALQAL